MTYVRDGDGLVDDGLVAEILEHITDQYRSLSDRPVYRGISTRPAEGRSSAAGGSPTLTDFDGDTVIALEQDLLKLRLRHYDVLVTVMGILVGLATSTKLAWLI